MPLNEGAPETLACRRGPSPVRGELIAAHRRAWTRLVAPGEWWTGAARVSAINRCFC